LETHKINFLRPQIIKHLGASPSRPEAPDIINETSHR
jgi:hypothetical protein